MGVCSGIPGWQGVSGFMGVEVRGCAVPLLSFGCFDAGPLELSELWMGGCRWRIAVAVGKRL
jgi:hypothetical protein